MAKIYTKMVNGKKYRYERLSTKRVGKKVITKDRCLGPVDPVQRGKIEQAPPDAQQRLKKMYEGFATLPEIVRWLAEDTGIIVSERTITNYMSRHSVKRGFKVEHDMSAFMKNVHAQKKAAKTATEKKAVEHLKILLDEGAIKPGDIAKLSVGFDVAAIESLWAKYHTKRAR